jgi:hypothetical protein
MKAAAPPTNIIPNIPTTISLLFFPAPANPAAISVAMFFFSEGDVTAGSARQAKRCLDRSAGPRRSRLDIREAGPDVLQSPALSRRCGVPARGDSDARL